MVYTINNKEYLLFEETLPDKVSIEDFIKKVKRYGGIVQYYGVDRGGLWSKTFVVCKALIPSESALEFDK